ncbi:glycosyltransferase [Schumannella luteola]|uniref:Glycosyltransferase involved in cell wall biosynthesis n=1 Tax=Schumannella luteola TaxID=472059 RepID=A0A852YFU4_9MICO|nr:glycosyltransferase family 2 protein [Schumannella luteola]NYH00155.1 glycosyltransferase involved in cell wall biosynthesis [Schumannella luteola]TPX04086.1 glycosyltransferase family 2 protein [Schumannella luteola]
MTDSETGAAVTAPGARSGVSVVIATRGRPELLRSAVRAALAQQHDGAVEVIVVFDQTEIDELGDVEVPVGRTVCTIANARTPGLAGGRNTGVAAARHELIAFCDDDDEWMPTRLARQLAAWGDDPSAVVLATGIRIRTAESEIDRVPPQRADFDDFLRSRITEIHPSSFLLRREDLVGRDDVAGRVGPVDEQLPAAYGEDYDLLLRAARVGHVRSVPEPLVLVRWNRASFFSEKWEGIAAGLTYLLRKHPEFARDPRGSARVEGQIAFAHAALGERPEARAWARRAIRHDRRQLRAWAAMLIALRLLPAGALVRAVNRRGRGL